MILDNTQERTQLPEAPMASLLIILNRGDLLSRLIIWDIAIDLYTAEIYFLENINLIPFFITMFVGFVLLIIGAFC